VECLKSSAGFPAPCRESEHPEAFDFPGLGSLSSYQPRRSAFLHAQGDAAKQATKITGCKRGMNKRPASILVVEDNPITRKLLRVALQGDGYAVFEAADGRAALELAEAHDEIDLVLQDLLLPDMHGVELIQSLRNIPGYDAKPIIAVTGLVSRLEEAHSVRSGFTAYLLKPVEPSRLLETVQTYLPKINPQAEKPGRNLKVLLVNDDLIGLKLEKFHLEEAGFEVNAVDNAERALDIAQASPPDAIVTDLVMPGVNGLELTMLIRKNSSLCDIPVIVNSATYSVIDAQDQQAANDMGADYFVLRTPNLDQVIAALLTALKKKQKAQPARNAEELLREFNRRLIHQLEVQASQRAQELRRAALETAKLTVLTGVAEVLNQRLGLDRALEEALARTVDASGVSTGAIYLKDEHGELRLRAHLGFAEPQVAALTEVCANRETLDKVFQERKPLVVSSAGMKLSGLTDLLAGGLVTSLVLVPLVAFNEPQGMLLLASAKQELMEAWLDLADAIGAQLAQAVLLSRTLTRVAESEQRFRELAENIKEIFFIAGPDGTPIHYVSRAYEDVTGRKSETLYHNPRAWLEDVHDEDRPRVERALRSDPQNFSQEYRIVCPDGTIRWMHTRAFPVKDKSGAVVRVVGISEDNTARTLAEEQLRLRDARIRALNEIGTAMTSILDLSGRLDILLEKIEILLPYAATTIRLYDKESQFLEPVACRNLDQTAWRSTGLQGDDEPDNIVFRGRAPLFIGNLLTDSRVGAREFYREQALVSYVGIPLIVKEEILGTLGLYTRHEREFSADEIDFLTTLGAQVAMAIYNSQLYEEIKSQAGELARANEVKSEFLDLMSHELKTPIGMMMGYVEVVQEGMLGEIKAEQSAALKQSLDHSRRLLNMITGILEATKLRARDVSLHATSVNLKRFFADLKSDFGLSPKQDVTLKWHLPGDLPVVKTDAYKLKQILQSLIDNAIKFTDAGTVEVTARSVPDSDRLELEVTDTGRGIASDQIAGIFDLFRQIDSLTTRSHEGAGLGLYLVKKNTELLGGEVKVTSELGKGSKFTVSLRIPEARREPGSTR
jgi:PAS domain S-box-containing protein